MAEQDVVLGDGDNYYMDPQPERDAKLLEPHLETLKKEAERLSNEQEGLTDQQRQQIEEEALWDLKGKLVNVLVANDGNPNGAGSMEDPNYWGMGGENQRTVETNAASSSWGLMDWIVIGGGVLIVFILLLVLLT